MTPNQKSLYWRSWSAVRKALVDLGDYSAAEADEQRHAIHIAAIGQDKSSNSLSNRDLDAILDQFDQVLVLLKGPHKIDRVHEQPVKRLIWSIEQLGLPDAYIAAIAGAEFKVQDWRKLDEKQLTRFRYTLTNRSRSLRKKALADPHP